MTHWMHPPELERLRERDHFDPAGEGEHYGLSRELSLAIWERVCADAVGSTGRSDEEQARRQFHEFAARFTERGGWLHPDVGKSTRVGVEINSVNDMTRGIATLQASLQPNQTIPLKLSTPGRRTLVDHAASPRLDFDDFRVLGLKAMLQRLGPNHPLRQEIIATAVDVNHSIAGRATLWRERLFRAVTPNGHALWQVAERHAVTLYRRAVSNGEIEQHDPIVQSALQQRGTGQPLPMEIRHEMERELGVSLVGVRIHTDMVAAQAARVLAAEAFTVGEDIFFASGTFAPDTRSGRKLLAHELVHVAQMLRGDIVPAGGGLRVSQPDEPLEREADETAERTDQAAILPTQERSGNGVVAPSVPHANLDRSPDGATLIQRRPDGPVYGPPAPTGAGNDFDMFLLQFSALESAAVAEGYSFNGLITAFRKLYYDSVSAAKTYAGAVVGGGAWNILIPGAAGTKLPASWTTGSLVGAADYVRKHQVLNIAGKQVDIGHLLAGADAAKHPTSLGLAAGMIKLRSNQEATTFIGDIGSVVTEYIHGSKASFRDTAMVRSAVLDSYYDGTNAMASAADMAGNADSYALTFDFSKSLSRNLQDYYAATSGGVNKRYTRFADAIGLGALVAGTKFTGDTTSWRKAMVDEVFNSALAYAAGKGWKGDVANVFADPGPGIFTPTFWEMYFNVSGWVVDIFVSRMVAAVAKE